MTGVAADFVVAQLHKIKGVSLEQKRGKSSDAFKMNVASRRAGD